MNDTPMDIIARRRTQKKSTDAGTLMHERLRRVVIDGDTRRGDNDLITRIQACPALVKYFSTAARTEVPIAYVDASKHVSRRIDRMIIDHESKTVLILDYKTDTDKKLRRAHYVDQLGEYAHIMRRIYPEYEIKTHILWTHDWTLEEIKTLETQDPAGL